MKEKIHPLKIIMPVSLIFFAIPILIRLLSGNNLFPGEYSYYHLSQYSKGISLYHVIIQKINPSFGTYAVFSTLLMLLCVYLFYKLLCCDKKDWLSTLTPPLFFAVSPIAIYLSFFLTPYILSLFLLLVILNVLRSKYFLYSVIPLAFLLFFDWLTFISSLIIITTYLFLTKNSKKISFLLAFIVAFLILHFYHPQPLVFEIFHGQRFFVNFFSEFGSVHGIGLFMSLLAIVGFILSWKQKIKFLPVYIASLLFLILFFLMGVATIIYAFPLIVLFASTGFVYFWKRKWNFDIIRYLTLAILLYGVLFSTIAYMNRNVLVAPKDGVFESIEWVNKHPFYSSSKILSHPQKSFWIEYKTENPLFIDYLSDEYDEKNNITTTIFNSKDFRKTVDLLEEHNITLIWVDETMKKGQVWDKDDEGLLYLFSDERFQKVYDTNGIEIWRFR